MTLSQSDAPALPRSYTAKKILRLLDSGPRSPAFIRWWLAPGVEAYGVAMTELIEHNLVRWDGELWHRRR
jgi:hypothetical protein